MKKNDFEYVKEKFDQAAPQMTERMDSKVLRRRILEENGQKLIPIRQKKHSRKPFAAVAALAACLALVITAVTAFLPQNSTPLVDRPGNTQQPAQPESDVPHFKSYDELNARVQQSQLPEFGGGTGEVIRGLHDAEEPYRIMADGDYIYYAYENSNYDFPNGEDGYGRNKIYIYKADGENTALVHTIDDAFTDGFDLNSLYVQNGRLIVSAGSDHAGLTKTKIYDVSDPTAPQLISESRQNGYNLRTFFAEDTAYVFTCFTVTDVQNAVPLYSENGETTQLEAQHIYYMQNATASQYMLITAIDWQNDGAVKDAKAVFGAGYILDCAENDAFISESDQKDEIIKISMNGQSIGVYSAEKKEIPSFGTYENLIEVADNKYLSFSYEDTDKGNTATLYSAQSGKLTVLDRIELENIYVDAADNANNAIFCDAGILLPCYFATPETRIYGAITVAIQNDKIVVTNKFQNEDADAVYAGSCITIGDYIYSFNINDMKPDSKKLKVFAYKVNN